VTKIEFIKCMIVNLGSKCLNLIWKKIVLTKVDLNMHKISQNIPQSKSINCLEQGWENFVWIKINQMM